jgi:hypothetical protein
VTLIRLSRSATITPTPAGVLLRSDLGTFQITGADAGTFLTKLAPLLDGSRDRDAISAALAEYSSASVERFLDMLDVRGLIEEVPSHDHTEHGRGQLEFFQRWSADGPGAWTRLAEARVLVAGAEPWGEVAARELAASGIGEIDRFEGTVREPERSLVVAAVCSDDGAEIERIARSAHRAGVRTLWSHLEGSSAVLGPLTVPFRTACRVCAESSAVNPRLGAPPAEGPRAAIMARHLGHLVALEVLAIVSGYAETRLGGRALIQDLTTFETTLATLVRLPWCRVCGRRAW